MIAAPHDVITPLDVEVASLMQRMHVLCVQGIRVAQVAEAMETCGYPPHWKSVCAVLAKIDDETMQLEARLRELIPLSRGGTLTV